MLQNLRLCNYYYNIYFKIWQSVNMWNDHAPLNLCCRIWFVIVAVKWVAPMWRHQGCPVGGRKFIPVTRGTYVEIFDTMSLAGLKKQFNKANQVSIVGKCLIVMILIRYDCMSYVTWPFFRKTEVACLFLDRFSAHVLFLSKRTCHQDPKIICY